MPHQLKVGRKGRLFHFIKSYLRNDEFLKREVQKAIGKHHERPDPVQMWVCCSLRWELRKEITRRSGWWGRSRWLRIRLGYTIPTRRSCSQEMLLESLSSPMTPPWLPWGFFPSLFQIWFFWTCLSGSLAFFLGQWKTLLKSERRKW